MKKKYKLFLVIVFIMMMITILCPVYSSDYEKPVHSVNSFYDTNDSFKIGQTHAFIGKIEDNVIEVNGDMSEVRIKDSYYKFEEKKDGWIVYKIRDKK